MESKRYQRMAFVSAVVSATALFLSCEREKVESATSTPQVFESDSKTRILVAYYSRSGTTKSLAEAVVDGIRSVKNTDAVIKMVDEVETDDLLSADGVVVGSPVFYGNMAYQVKQFFDNWNLKYGIYHERKMKNKAGGAFATGYWTSGGKEMVINSINAAFMNAAMVVVSGLKGAGASATGEIKESGRGKELMRFEYEDGFDLGQRVALVAAALKHCYRKKEMVGQTNGTEH